MTIIDFKTRLATYKGLPSADCFDDPELLKRHPEYRYILTTRKRGRAYVDRIRRIDSKDLGNISLLDIGCAYGGITIEAAKAGAKAVGVDVVPSYIDLARHNAKDDVDVEFFFGDMTMRTTVMQMGGRRFDTFILNHVLEHIYDTISLLENIERIATDDAVIYFDVPNGHSITSFRAEGHTNIFAASLAEPDCWFMFGLANKRARIYYRKLRYFEVLFAASGFRLILAKDAPRPRHEMEAQLRTAMDEFRSKADSNTFEFVERFCSEAEYDISNASDETLDLKYFHYFWRGVAYRDESRLRMEYRNGLPIAAWGND